MYLLLYSLFVRTINFRKVLDLISTLISRIKDKQWEGGKKADPQLIRPEEVGQCIAEIPDLKKTSEIFECCSGTGENVSNHRQKYNHEMGCSLSFKEPERQETLYLITRHLQSQLVTL